jgi:hypothetical protein
MPGLRHLTPDMATGIALGRRYVRGGSEEGVVENVTYRSGKGVRVGHLGPSNA